MNIKKLFTLLVSSLFIFSCSSSDDKDNVVKEFQLKKAKSTVEWKAYKTTQRDAVDGSFKTVNIISNAEGNTIKEALEAAEFTIPIEDILAGGKEYNIIHSFFGVMVNPDLISGTIYILDETTGYIALNMGGVTGNLNFEYKIIDKKFTLNTIMNLSDWNAAASIESLNLACKLLHAGGDGVVKLWNDIPISASVDFSESAN